VAPPSRRPPFTDYFGFVCSSPALVPWRKTAGDHIAQPSPHLLTRPTTDAISPFFIVSNAWLLQQYLKNNVAV
jgi:hypothetical protein